MSFNVKSEILSAIAKTDDQNMKSLLLLMLGVLEDIGSKIDKALSDEKALRETVLNGHEPVHHLHHEWVSKKLAEEEENGDSARKIRDHLIEKVIWAALSFVCAYLLLKTTG